LCVVGRRCRVSAGGASNLAARALPVLARVGRPGGAPAEPGQDPPCIPRWRSSRTSPRQARSSGLRDARFLPRGGLHAATATNHSSRCGRTGHIGAGGTTSLRLLGTRRSQGRSAAPPDRSCAHRAWALPPRGRTSQWRVRGSRPSADSTRAQTDRAANLRAGQQHRSWGRRGQTGQGGRWYGGKWGAAADCSHRHDGRPVRAGPPRQPVVAVARDHSKSTACQPRDHLRPQRGDE
jgi:hypothetical protein